MSAAFHYGPFVERIAFPAEYSFNNRSFSAANSNWPFDQAVSRAFLAISTALANWQQLISGLDLQDWANPGKA